MKINISLIITLFLLNACSSIQITSNYDTSSDFTKYKTFSFLGWADDSELILTKFDQKRFEKSFTDELKKRGLTQVAKNGDLAVSLYIVVDSKTSRTSYTTYYSSGGYGYAGWGWGMGASNTSYHDYDYLVGTLICDIFDDTKKELIWQGVASGKINKEATNRDRIIPRIVTSIMTRYPIPPMKK